MVDKSGPLMGWAVKQANQVWLDAVSNPDGANVGELYWQEVAKAAKQAPRDRKQEAANLGTEVHNVLERVAKEPEPSGVIETASPEAAQRALQAIAWLNEQNCTPVAVERRVYSRKHRFVGTLDKLFLVRGKLTLLDWKTSKGIWPEYLFQTAAYCGAYEEETGEKIAQRCLVRLGEDGTLEPHWFNRTSQKKDYSAFLGLLRGYKRLKELKGEQ